MGKCQVPLQNPIFIQGEVPETQVSCFLYIINYFRLLSEDILHGFLLTMDSYLSIVWHTCPSFDIVIDRNVNYVVIIIFGIKPIEEI